MWNHFPRNINKKPLWKGIFMPISGLEHPNCNSKQFNEIKNWKYSRVCWKNQIWSKQIKFDQIRLFLIKFDFVWSNLIFLIKFDFCLKCALLFLKGLIWIYSGKIKPHSGGSGLKFKWNPLIVTVNPTMQPLLTTSFSIGHPNCENQSSQ